jgi:hypothetical protein
MAPMVLSVQRARRGPLVKQATQVPLGKLVPLDLWEPMAEMAFWEPQAKWEPRVKLVSLAKQVTQALPGHKAPRVQLVIRAPQALLAR